MYSFSFIKKKNLKSFFINSLTLNCEVIVLDPNLNVSTTKSGIEKVVGWNIEWWVMMKHEETSIMEKLLEKDQNNNISQGPWTFWFVCILPQQKKKKFPSQNQLIKWCFFPLLFQHLHEYDTVLTTNFHNYFLIIYCLILLSTALHIILCIFLLPQ